jgi:putative glutamine amidotransferase
MKARHTRPSVAIYSDFRTPAGTNVHLGYFEVVQAVGGLPMLLSASAQDAEIDACLDRIQAVILDGPPDLDPRRQPPTAGLLCRRLRERRLPVLAIGQGMQQLNAVHGGTLYPPLPEDQPGVLSHSQPRHAVLLERGTRIEAIYGRDEITVQSKHRQAIRRVGAGLRVSGLAPDGVIEAVETVDETWFCVGIQWHPETDAPAAPDLRLFACVIDACGRQARLRTAAA